MAVETLLTCDMPDCGAELKLPGPYWKIKSEMKAAGWKNQKINDEWKIKCNKHQGENK
jgi:hypothetical protein